MAKVRQTRDSTNVRRVKEQDQEKLTDEEDIKRRREKNISEPCPMKGFGGGEVRMKCCGKERLADKIADIRDNSKSEDSKCVG